MTQFGRVLVVEVAGLVITRPRISVRVTLDNDNTQDTGSVAIYNLAPGTEDQIFERAKSIKVLGGYRGRIGTLFEGATQRVQRRRVTTAGVTRMTVIDLGNLTRAGSPVDGVAALGGVTARSYAGPQNVRAIARDLAADAGLAVGPLDAIPAAATATNWAWSGAASDALTALVGAVGCGWYEDGGQLRVRRRGSPAQPDRGIWLLSPQTGLVGAPTPTDEGAQCRVLLNPGIARGARVRLASDTLEGEFTTVTVRHSADNWEGRFVTDLELRPA